MPPEVESGGINKNNKTRDKEEKDGIKFFTAGKSLLLNPEEDYLYGRDKKVESLSKEFKETKEKYETALAIFEQRIEKLSDEKSSYLLYFGLFASILSFFSIELQIFKTVDSYWMLIGLSMIFLSLMLLFNVVVFHLSIFQEKENKHKIDVLYWILGFIFGFGIIFSLLDRIDAIQKWPPSEKFVVGFLEKQKLENSTFSTKIDSAFILLDSIDHKLKVLGKNQK